jgi:hypothetical protein
MTAMKRVESLVRCVEREVSSAIVVIAIMLAAQVSWGLDWQQCNEDLKGVGKEAAAASHSTYKLRDLYERHEENKFQLDSCISFHGDCRYLRLAVNELSIAYQEERSRFNGIMQALNGHLLSMKKTCGYKFDANILGHAGE